MKIRNKKTIIFLGAGIIMAGVIGSAIAVSRDRSVFNNDFQVDFMGAEFTEEFESPSKWKTCETVQKTITVKNNTDQNIIARVKLEEEWTGKNGIGLPLVSNGSGEKMAIINFTENSDWTLDGTYYYSQPIEPGATSSSPITGVTLNCDANLDVDTRYADAQYKLNIKAQTIQADLAATEWHKTSVLLPMSTVKQKMSRLSSSTTSRERTRRFLQADSLGIDLNNISEDNIVSYYGSEGSNTYTYMWFDVDEYAMYWYSDADDVYMSDGKSSDMFFYYSDLSGLYNINTSRTTHFDSLFQYYNGTSLHGLEKWDMSNAVSIYNMFWTSGNGNINDLTALARWDVSNVKDMKYAFNGHDVPDVTPLAGWNVRNVTDFSTMFQMTNVGQSICALADWPINTQNLERVFYMFTSRDNVTSHVDARCLEPWNIPRDLGRNLFGTDYAYLPSWAISN